ncbi:MAG: hypothetical protein H7839_08645 [Magnetococcus sp. YQC-5]
MNTLNKTHSDLPSFQQTPVLRRIDATDYPALVEFCANFPKETRSTAFWLQRFHFWWEDNPAFVPEFPRGCLLESGTQVVGMFALIPTRISWNGKVQLAANMSCWRVLPTLRKYSLQMFVAIMEYASAYPIFDTTPTLEVRTILQRVPFIHYSKKVKTETILIHRSLETGWLENTKEIYRIYLNWVPALRTENKIIAITRAMWLYLKQMQRLKRAADGQGELKCVTDIGPAFDQLWHRTQDRYSFTNVREASDLRWYITKNPNARKMTLLVHEKQGELLAYGLFMRVSTHHWPDRETFYAVDLWSAAPDKINLLPLLGYALNIANQQGMQVLRIPHYHDVLSDLCSDIGVTYASSDSMNSYYYPPQSCQPSPEMTTYISKNMGDFGL